VSKYQWEKHSASFICKGLAKIRDEQGRTTQDVADLLGVSEETIRKYENGKLAPTLETLFRYLALLEPDQAASLTGHLSKAVRRPKKRRLKAAS
jgi:transcriptional regulator with XRE-family HTH domain